MYLFLNEGILKLQQNPSQCFAVTSHEIIHGHWTLDTEH